MQTIATRHRAFVAQLHGLFPQPELSGVMFRHLAPPVGPQITVVYVHGLVAPAELERLVLNRVARGIPPASPADLARSGHFPAPDLRVARDTRALQEGLLAGLAALHVDGYEGALLLGAGQPAPAQDAFTPGIDNCMALLHRHLRRPDFRLEVHLGAQGSRFGLAYLDGVASPDILAAVRAWAWELGPRQPRSPWWQALPGVLRLPPAVDSSAPGAVAVALRRGYVAVLAEHVPGALLAPTTLELLLSGSHDLTLVPAVRRLVTVPRVLAALAALTVGAWFVAVASYHHALLPGTFLMALASSRRNLPLPIVMEVLLVELLGDLMRAGATRLGGGHWTFLGTIGMVLAAMTALQAGVFAPVSVIIGIASAVVLQVLPNPTLGRAVRAWRYLFIGAAAGLGVYGMALLAFALMAYLADERPFGHPLRRPPGAVCG